MKEYNNTYIERINYPILTNQYVIRVIKPKPEMLFELLEKICLNNNRDASTMMLATYLGKNRHGFIMVLSPSVFCKKYGYSERTYTEAKKKLREMGLLYDTGTEVQSKINGVITNLWAFDLTKM